MNIKILSILKAGLLAVTACLLLGMGSIAAAQTFQVSGKVINAINQEPLVGVSILEVGTQNGTATDVNGHFLLTVSSENASLRFSYIGFKTKTIEVNGRSNITVSLQSSVTNLNQLVVTALGIKKHKNSIGYATQNISSEELTKVKTPNLVNSLQGKAAGVLITKGTSGPGSSSRIIIRGNKSFTGNSAPLYVIDGVPISQGSGSSRAGSLFSNFRDTGNPISNINPADIQSIQVLKGAAASALYGSEAANGVIVITTKNGHEGRTKVNVYSTTTFKSPIHTPETQTEYGVSSGYYSWGSKISDGDNSFISDFFNTGVNLINGVSVGGGNDMFQFFGSFSNTNASGIIPNNKLIKDNIYFSGSGQFLENNSLTVHASVRHTRKHLKNPPRSGFYRSPTAGLYLFPPSDDFSKYDNEGSKTYKKWNNARGLYVQHWGYLSNNAGLTNQNPYWIVNRILQSNYVNQTLMQFKANYDITGWLSFQARTSINMMHNRNTNKIYAGSYKILAGTAGHKSGNYSTGLSNSRSIYSDFLLNGAGSLSENFGLDATIGFSNSQGYSYNLNMASNGDAGMIYPNVFTVTNFISPAIVGGAAQFNYGESEYKSLSQALFGTATFDYNKTVFLTVTGRNEWSYTSLDQPFFYPSVDLSYVLTNTTGTSDVLSYLKLRASYSEVGSPLPRGVNDTSPPFSINTATGSINTDRTLPFFSGQDTANLVPERTVSYEAGFQLGLFKNKLNLNFTYYNATTKKQIFTIAAPAGSGAKFFYINGGSIRNAGVEAILNYSDSFGKVHWNSTLNFSHNVNTIRQISDKLSTKRFVISSIDNTRLVASFLTRPEDGYYGSFGDYYGKTLKRNSDGSLALDNNGLPVLTDNDGNYTYVGNPNPHYLAGFQNSFSYKGWNLSFLISGRFGGYVYSLTQAWLDATGLSKRSARDRDRGYAMLDGHKITNVKGYYQAIGGNEPAALQYRYSATNIRLRELSLGYTFSNLGNFVNKINIAVTGRNLFFFYKDAPYDPEKSMAPGSSIQGISAFGMPATRSYGFNVNIQF